MDESLDERERMLRNRSYAAGAATVAVLCTAAALLFSLPERFAIWVPRTRHDWSVIFFFLVILLNVVPPLHASWTTRPIPDEA